MTQRKDKLRSKCLKALLQELPYFNFRGDLAAYHGPFNNSLLTSSKTKKSLDKLSSLYDPFNHDLSRWHPLQCN